MFSEKIYANDPLRGIGGLLYTTFQPSTTTTEQIIEDADEKEKLENFTKVNYFNVAKEAASNCGEYVNALYEVGTYDERFTKDLFCEVLQKDFEILFKYNEYNDYFLSELENKVNSANIKLTARWQSEPLSIVRHLAIQDGCKDAGNVRQVEHFENFVITCSGNTMKFNCHFPEEIVYNTKGYPYRILYISRLKSYKVLPACWRTDYPGVVQRLAIQNGCENVGDILKVKQDGNVKSFVIACSEGSMEFQCDLQEETIYDITTGTPYNKGRGNLCSYKYYEYGKTCTYQIACSRID